jgi:hypothetical protein
MGTSVTLVKQYGNPTFNSLTVSGSTNFTGSLNITGSLRTTGSISTIGSITATTSITANMFTGSGAGLTGTAASLNIGGNSATTSQRTFSNVRTDGINRGSYGSISVAGSNNSYGGIDFTDQSMTLMINAGATGFYYTNNTWRVYWDGSGNQVNTGDVTAYASDKRLKTNIVNIPNALDKIRSINGVTYDWKLDECAKWDFTPQKHDVGVIAQEIQEICPEAVTFAPFDRDPIDGGKSKSGENYLTVKYEKLVPLLIEAIKEQQSQIEELKTTINGLTR